MYNVSSTNFFQWVQNIQGAIKAIPGKVRQIPGFLKKQPAAIRATIIKTAIAAKELFIEIKNAFAWWHIPLAVVASVIFIAAGSEAGAFACGIGAAIIITDIAFKILNKRHPLPLAQVLEGETKK